VAWSEGRTNEKRPGIGSRIVKTVTQGGCSLAEEKAEEAEEPTAQSVVAVPYPADGRIQRFARPRRRILPGDHQRR